MLSPSQYGTVLVAGSAPPPPDRRGSTFTANDFSSTLRMRHCEPLSTKMLPCSPWSPTNLWSSVPIMRRFVLSNTLNLSMSGMVDRFSKW